MAGSLKTVIVPPKGAHTATVIFMHVRRHRVLPVPSSDPHLLHRGWVILATVGSQLLINSRATRVSNTLNGSSPTRK